MYSWYMCMYTCIKYGGLPSTGVNTKFADFNLADRAAGMCCTQCHDLILADFNLAVGLSICQIVKLNSLPNFLAIRYICSNKVPLQVGST